MWTWILGAAGLAGFAGLVYAKRKKQRNRAKADCKPDNSVMRPRLARAKATLWEAFDLADSTSLSTEERAERAEERVYDVEALSRIVASEAGLSSFTTQWTVAWLARNRALSTRMRLIDLAAPDGTWGPITTIRPLSSSQPPTLDSRRIAEEVLDAPQSEDPIDGATHGFDASLQDRLAEIGRAQHDAEAVIDLWTTHYGLEPHGEVGSWRLYR